MLAHDMRPDLCGAIVMLDQLDWQDAPVIVAASTGQHLPEATQNRLYEISRSSGHPLVMVEFKQDHGVFKGDFDLKMLGPQAFQDDMVRHFEYEGFDRTPLGTQLDLMYAPAR
jgi:hypothetical protein